MPLEFRFAAENDAAGIFELTQAAFAEYRDTIPVAPGALRESLEDVRAAAREGRVLLAFDHDPGLVADAEVFGEGRLAGSARYEPRGDSLYIGRVAVHPDYRRRGVGTALMRELEALALRLGYAHVSLATRESMPANIIFYEGLGYRITRREPHPRGADVIVWFEKSAS